MTTYVDHNYFEELAKAAPGEVCRNGRCRFDTVGKWYSLDIWGEEYVIDCIGHRIERSSTVDSDPHEFFSLFVMYYLLLPQDIKTSGEWISEKDLPGGTTFFRGPHRIPTETISGRFGNDLEALRECCQKLGGTAIGLGDASFRFDIAPDIPVAVVYWQGDEDFPAEAGLLYDRSIAKLLPLDIVFALAVAVCSRIGAKANCA